MYANFMIIPLSGCCSTHNHSILISLWYVMLTQTQAFFKYYVFFCPSMQCQLHPLMLIFVDGVQWHCHMQEAFGFFIWKKINAMNVLNYLIWDYKINDKVQDVNYMGILVWIEYIRINYVGIQGQTSHAKWLWKVWGYIE